VILELIGAGDTTEAVVNFRDVGEKRLLLAWAPIAEDQARELHLQEAADHRDDLIGHEHLDEVPRPDDLPRLSQFGPRVASAAGVDETDAETG